MERTPVQSSNLESVGYDIGTQTLEIAFKRGGVYQYLAVPAEVFHGLIVAASLGTYFDVNIKRAGYQYRRLST